MIVQVSVVKDPARVGRVRSLLSKVADAYVVGVDRSSANGTRREIEKILRQKKKPFQAYDFDWQRNFSMLLNQAVEKAEDMGATRVMRIDSDQRFSREATWQEIKGYIGNSDKPIIQVPSISKIGSICCPILAINRGIRFVGRIYEALDRPQKYKDVDMAPFIMLHLVDNPKEKSISTERLEILAEEAGDLYARLPEAKTPEKIFALAERFKQLSFAHNARADEWKDIAIALYQDCIRQGYEVGDCYMSLAQTIGRESIIQGESYEYYLKAVAEIGQAINRVMKSIPQDRATFARFAKEARTYFDSN